MRRLRRLLGNGRINLPGKTFAQGRMIQEHITSRIPMSGEQLGKSIEKKLSSSQKVWSNVSIAIFSQKALENVTHFSSYVLGIIMLILTDIVMIFPTDRKSLAFGALATNFLMVFAGLIMTEAVVYAAMRAFRSGTSFKTYFATVNTAVFMSLVVFALPAALVSFALFSTMLKSQYAIKLMFSLIPFYNYLVFGWSSETVARLRGIKSYVIGVVSLLLILFLNLILQEMMI
jgi:hypothetical protein